MFVPVFPVVPLWARIGQVGELTLWHSVHPPLLAFYFENWNWKQLGSKGECGQCIGPEQESQKTVQGDAVLGLVKHLQSAGGLRQGVVPSCSNNSHRIQGNWSKKQ